MTGDVFYPWNNAGDPAPALGSGRIPGPGKEALLRELPFWFWREGALLGAAPGLWLGRAACPGREARPPGLGWDSVEYGPVSRADDPSLDWKWSLNAFFSVNQIGQVDNSNGNVRQVSPPSLGCIWATKDDLIRSILKIEPWDHSCPHPLNEITKPHLIFWELSISLTSYTEVFLRELHFRGLVRWLLQQGSRWLLRTYAIADFI